MYNRAGEGKGAEMGEKGHPGRYCTSAQAKLNDIPPSSPANPPCPAPRIYYPFNVSKRTNGWTSFFESWSEEAGAQSRPAAWSGLR